MPCDPQETSGAKQPGQHGQDKQTMKECSDSKSFANSHISGTHMIVLAAVKEPRLLMHRKRAPEFPSKLVDMHEQGQDGQDYTDRGHQN